MVLPHCVNFREPQAVRAYKGCINLSTAGYVNTKTFSLNGEWEFYFNQFIFPENSEQFNDKNLTSYIDIPDSRNNVRIKGQNLPSNGYATYRFKISLPAHLKNRGLRMPNVNSL
jgi:hypothetical protein